MAKRPRSGLVLILAVHLISTNLHAEKIDIGKDHVDLKSQDSSNSSNVNVNVKITISKTGDHSSSTSDPEEHVAEESVQTSVAVLPSIVPGQGKIPSSNLVQSVAQHEHHDIYPNPTSTQGVTSHEDGNSDKVKTVSYVPIDSHSSPATTYETTGHSVSHFVHSGPQQVRGIIRQHEHPNSHVVRLHAPNKFHESGHRHVSNAGYANNQPGYISSKNQFSSFTSSPITTQQYEQRPPHSTTYNVFRGVPESTVYSAPAHRFPGESYSTVNEYSQPQSYQNSKYHSGGSAEMTWFPPTRYESKPITSGRFPTKLVSIPRYDQPKYVSPSANHYNSPHPTVISSDYDAPLRSYDLGPKGDHHNYFSSQGQTSISDSNSYSRPKILFKETTYYSLNHGSPSQIHYSYSPGHSSHNDKKSLVSMYTQKGKLPQFSNLISNYDYDGWKFQSKNRFSASRARDVSAEEFHSLMSSGRDEKWRSVYSSKPAYVHNGVLPYLLKSYGSKKKSYSTTSWPTVAESIDSGYFTDSRLFDAIRKLQRKKEVAYGGMKQPGSVSDEHHFKSWTNYGTPLDVVIPSSQGFYRSNGGSWNRIPYLKQSPGYKYKYNTLDMKPPAEEYFDNMYTSDGLNTPNANCENSHSCDTPHIASTVDLTRKKPRRKGFFKNSLFTKLIRNVALKKRRKPCRPPPRKFRGKGNPRRCRGKRCHKVKKC